MQAAEIMTDYPPGQLNGKVYYSQHKVDKLASDKICKLIATGGGLPDICKKDNMPSYNTVMRWLEKFQDFRERYTLAREAQQDYEADNLIAISDNPNIEPENKRLMIDARKWRASKLAPKKYGDKQQIDLNTTVDINALIISAASRGLEILSGDKADSAKTIEHIPDHIESIEDYL